MNSNQLSISYYQNQLLPGTRPAPLYGDVRAVNTTSSWTREPLPYNIGDIAVSFDYFKSWVPAPNEKNYLGLEDDIYRAPGMATDCTTKWVSLTFGGITENNHSFNKGNEVDDNLPTTEPLDCSICEEASTGHLNPYNHQNSHNFTLDASNGLTGSMQSVLVNSLGSKGKLLVIFQRI
jgi:hypothetical protein